MDENLYNTLHLLDKNNGNVKVHGESDQDYEDFDDLVLKMRELHRLGFINFEERKGKVIRNGRNRKSEYIAAQYNVEYQGKNALSYGSFSEYLKNMTKYQEENFSGANDDLKIFISHSENDVKIAEKLVNFLLSSLNINDDEIRCSSVPGHMLKFGSISEIIKNDLVKNPIIIFLVTQRSLKSQWVMFELGASWIKNMTIVPIIGPKLSYENLPGPLDTHSAIEIDNPNVQNRLMDAVKQISEEKQLTCKTGGKQINCLSSFLDTFKSAHKTTGNLKKYDDIVYKILACILKLRGVNQRATAIIIAEYINSTPEIVFAYLKEMHNDQLVTFISTEGLDKDSNFHLSELALQCLLHEPFYLEFELNNT